MSLEIIQVDASTAQAMEGVKIDMPAVAYVGIDDGVVVGSYGLAWGGGRCWAWLRLENGKPSYALTVMKRFKRLMLKAEQLGEREVFTPRDKQYHTSEKLLRLLGFQMHSIEMDMEVWRWQP
ncbi:hypothetical protein HGP16_25535 [Rhizobium sp. P40RR-XXII]|uniref:hypothetical protein n=1 Tax=Rhizobium sp. P40RR-XXII TaxID=2726739 RepID=UPI0014567885|nr:hypothetical protein [Rhizobium sp. P40RR-XXII]NLS19905.1 hypothetical protein [Rhizobium sp. P40RR-XXII]